MSKTFFALFFRSAKRYIIPIVAFSLIYNFPKFFELHTGVREWSEGNTTLYCIEGSSIRKNVIYYEVWSILSFSIRVMLRDMPNFYRLRPSYKIGLESIGKMHVCSNMREIHKKNKCAQSAV